MVNWRVRFKQPTFIITFLTAIVAFVYQILGMFQIVPSIAQGDIEQVILLLINMLVAVGIVQDPTTKGVSDSERAMRYDEPKQDNKQF